jgi:hypothetical protein
MRTLTKIGNGHPPTGQYSDADENRNENGKEAEAVVG